MAIIQGTSGQDSLVAPSGARRRPWLKIAVPVLVVALLAAFAWPAMSRWGSAERSVSLERLRTAVVTRGRFVSDVSAQGRAVAAVSPTLYATAPGVVTLQVAAGETVKKGQVLALVDSPDVRNELARESANLDGLRSAVARQRVDARTRQSQGRMAVELARVTVEAAERELERAKDAVRRGAIPAIEQARRADELKIAQVREQQMGEENGLLAEGLEFELRSRQQEAARQALLVDNLRRRADELSVRAPVDGVVGSLAVAQKAAVAANQPLLTVVDLSQLEVEIQVPETYAQSMGLGLGAEIAWGEQRHRGKLTAVSPEVQNGQVVARLRFDGETPSDLRQNQRVSVRIVLDERDGVLMVARGPFLEAGGGRSAYVIADGLARRTPIQIGATSIASVEVLAGLKEGDQIVLSGNDGFEDAETLYLRN
ncbi:MAG: efflux RND transporter periplasmic adaptor subunit [Stagnimonas sp.]|nr:efflux RND transporter periplasmic adaptor subunit [Stagnimonas sp.]